MRDELLSLPRHRRARRFFTRALREQDELLELYDRREARGGVLHPEAQRRFEQLKAAKAAAAAGGGGTAPALGAAQAADGGPFGGGGFGGGFGGGAGGG